MSSYADVIMGKLAQVEEKIEELLEQKALLREELLQDQLKTGLHIFSGTYGKSTVSKKDTYLYSDNIQELEDRLKLLRARERRNKKARVISSTKFVKINWN